MGAVAVFDYGVWAQSFPELSNVVTTPGQALAYFNMATLYLNNTGAGPVCDPTAQLSLLNLLTAHIAKMFAGSNGQGPSGLVGRINSAGEGSVSVSTENQYPPGSVQWYQQTSYGSAFWAATVQYRTARHVAAWVRPVDPYGPRRYPMFWRR